MPTAVLAHKIDTVLTGTVVYVENGYGFITDLSADGKPTAGQYFVRNGTLREHKRNKLKLVELDGKQVVFALRASNHPRHRGKLEACDIRLSPA